MNNTKKQLTEKDIERLFKKYKEITIFYIENHTLCCEIWKKKEEDYYFDFEKYKFSQEQCFSCIQHLLGHHDCKLYYGTLKKIR